MADLRITPGSHALGSQALAPVQPAARAEAAKAAQRAFFDAALAQAPAPAPVRTALAPAPAPQPQAARLNAAVAQDAGSADRHLLRPGSLLDIRV